jgi:hypothetical protein
MVQMCTMNLGISELNDFTSFIQNKFTYRLELDGLPSATVIKRNKYKDPTKGDVVKYHEGIPIGLWSEKSQKSFFFNHLEITVLVHRVNEEVLRIVGLEVEPFSIAEDSNRMSIDKTKLLDSQNDE